MGCRPMIKSFGILGLKGPKFQVIGTREKGDKFIISFKCLRCNSTSDIAIVGNVCRTLQCKKCGLRGYFEVRHCIGGIVDLKFLTSSEYRNSVKDN